VIGVGGGGGTADMVQIPVWQSAIVILLSGILASEAAAAALW